VKMHSVSEQANRANIMPSTSDQKYGELPPPSFAPRSITIFAAETLAVASSTRVYAATTALATHHSPCIQDLQCVRPR